MYQDTVFINCPYDADFAPQLWAAVFSVLDCRFEPTSGLAIKGGTKERLEKLKDLIAGSRFSIHDLSRADDDRFNMPFELGFALGLEHAERLRPQKGGKKGKPVELDRQVLVAAQDVAKAKKACSDLNGLDIAAYESPARLAADIAEWLAKFVDKDAFVPEPEQVATRFDDFWTRLNRRGPQAGIAIKKPKWKTMLAHVGTYITVRPPPPPGKIDWLTDD